MPYTQNWKSKPGYQQKGAERFLATGAPYAALSMIGRFQAPGLLEGVILIKAEDPKVFYEHAAEWAEFLDWGTNPIFTEEEASQICERIYS